MISNRVFAATACLIFFAGCSAPPPSAIVKGIVTINGQPGDKLRIEFHPNALKGTKGPSSFAKTDAEGQFTLVDPVAVGWHKVVVQDMRLSQSETGQGITMRLGPEYAKVLTTTVEVEVKPGDQSVTIELPVK